MALTSVYCLRYVKTDFYISYLYNNTSPKVTILYVSCFENVVIVRQYLAGISSFPIKYILKKQADVLFNNTHK